MYYDSRDERCKRPYGAVPCGAQVTLSLYTEGEAVTRAVMVAHGEFADSWTETELPALEIDGRKVFRGVYTAPAEGELVWYHFRLFWGTAASACWAKTGFASGTALRHGSSRSTTARAKRPSGSAAASAIRSFPSVSAAA